MQKNIFRPVKMGAATAIVLGTTLLSNFIGLARDKIIALHFGTSISTDIYNASFLIPDMIFNLFVAGALTAAFMPVFSDYIEKNEGESMKLANTMMNAMTGMIFILALLAFIFINPLIGFLFPNLDAATQLEIAKMTRLMLPSAMIFAVSNILGNILMSYKHFTAYSISPILYNIGIIAGVLLLKEKFGIYSAAIGVLVGAVLHCSVRIFDSIKTKYRYSFTLDLKQEGFKKIIKLMIPRTLSLIMWQINLYVFTIIGMRIMTGGLAAFNFARNIQSFTTALIGISFATAVFPFLTTAVSNNDQKSFTEGMQKTIQNILFYSIPACVGTLLMSKEIVSLILGGGAFNENSTKLTSVLLLAIAISIPFESLTQILARGFYAFKNWKTPMITTVISFAVIAIMTATITPLKGIQWLSINYSIGFILLVIMQSIFLGKYMQGFSIKEFTKSVTKMFFANVIMAISIFYTQPFENILSPSFSTLIRILLAIGIFFLTAMILKSKELSGLKLLTQKFTRKNS
ncbi:murein biosynthesis integral membrane protein MurJ [Candidatus Peregrinibacteria bacterium CG_4_10_14_0_2_um_filter_38_24]|nr:MAG: murein biosynthesis integral membrane protein MurJ [Candidatus Peregrinibacteria bacterium CG_4_10_14_0_2_um_filter_38_24]PJC39328.1 MAG: murein biosynthesis integral membrane protein MurJ [Candidatus Peregrinibacteria bacterium CG_4_9_14_0_2_um_filter_38_9]